MNYKAPDNSLHFLDDSSYADLLPQGSVPITDEEAEALRPAKVLVVYPTLTPRQIRMALTRAGLRDEVEAAVAAGDQDIKDWWEFSTAFERNHPEVLAMQAALSVSNSTLDALWALGASL